MLENKSVKADGNSFNIMEAMAISVFFKVLKGRYFIKIHYRVMSFNLNVAFVMVNKLLRFEENSLQFVKVVAEIC